jgi:methylenetetrahydrofolate reductase (NADPH)
MSAQESRDFSFEFFPPKTDEGVANLRRTYQELCALNPAFFSVTFGAGGSTRDRTLDTVLEIKKTGFDAAPHLSCIASSKADIRALLDTYQNHDIRHIVALRGDMPSGSYTGGELAHASDLVAYIRELTNDHFHIEVAAYPETHPQSTNTETDLKHFKQKVDAGANSAITQYFFNADAYFRFIDRIKKMGIEIPVVPGIMPITNYSKLARFSDACGAEIPRWVRKQLEAYGDDAQSIQSFGVDVVTELCEKLLAGGAPGLHFYSMNQSSACIKLWKNLKLA